MKHRACRAALLAVAALGTPALADTSLTLHCAPASYSGCGGLDATTMSCEDIALVGDATTPQFVFVLTANVGALTGLQFGVSYDSSVAVSGWSNCTVGAEIPSTTWPASGSSNAIALDDCDSQSGPLRCIGYFVVGAGSSGTLSVEPDARTGRGEWTDCDYSAHLFADTGFAIAAVDAGSSSLAVAACGTAEGEAETPDPSSIFEHVVLVDGPENCLLAGRFLRSEVALLGKVLSSTNVGVPPVSEEIRVKSVPAAMPIGATDQTLESYTFESDHFQILSVQVAWSVPAGHEGTTIEIARHRYTKRAGGVIQGSMLGVDTEFEAGTEAVFFLRSVELPTIGDTWVLSSDQRFLLGSSSSPAANDIREVLENLEEQNLNASYSLPNPEHVGWMTGTLASLMTSRWQGKRVYVLEFSDVVPPPGVSLPDPVQVRFTANWSYASTPLYPCGVSPEVYVGERLRISLCDGGSGDWYGCDDAWGVLRVSTGAGTARGQDEEAVLWRGSRRIAN